MTTHPTQYDAHERTTIGFWVYIMTDCVLFATLFAAHAVLKNNTFGGPSGQMLFSLPYALGETLLLLMSSFTCGMAMIDADPSKTKRMVAWFILTFLLGAGFLTMEVREFTEFVLSGNSWERSGFLTSFFTLVGTHGIHITVGLIWMSVLVVQLLSSGLTPDVFRRLTCLRLFWHFLDVVWIFIFTLVYLMGVL